ncbi:MAG: hypothetical protein WAX77_01760 [Methylococcaceae bacterium]
MVACIPKLLSEIIDSDLHFKPVDKKTLRLVEEKTAKKLSVDIRFDDYQLFCFSIDKDRNSEISNKDLIFPFFNPRAEGILSKNDFIIVAQKQNKVCIFLVELKSSNPKGYLKQLHAAKLFMKFILDKACLCHPDFKTLYDEFELEYKGILFHQPPITDKPNEEKSKSKNKKLLFNDIKGLPITQQNYDNIYYLSQFF